jgi:hypothetical protein
MGRTEWISRVEAARRFGVTPMAITKFARRGMPHRVSDGKVCWPDALYWSDCYRSPQSSGNWRARHPDYDPVEDEIEYAARELRRSQADAWYEARQAGMDAASIANRAIRRAAAVEMVG